MYSRDKLRAILSFTSAFGLLVFALTGCNLSPTSRSVRFSCGDWSYNATIRGVNAIIVSRSFLKFSDSPVPDGLVNAGFTFYTPIGRFSTYSRNLVPHATDPPWWTPEYAPPCRLEISVANASSITEDERRLGYTPFKNRGSDNSDGQIPLKQPPDTPSTWIYIERNDEGYWVDPTKLDALEAAL